jgi:prolyl-tRNA synthetase
MASVVEENHDKFGPFWPISIAPFQVQICCLGTAKDQTVAPTGLKLHDELTAAGFDVLLDRRSVGAGFMFADADLIGAPIRIILSPRHMPRGMAELKFRLAEAREDLPREATLDTLVETIRTLAAELGKPYA